MSSIPQIGEARCLWQMSLGMLRIALNLEVATDEGGL